jgi:hypothetical protein
MILVDYSGISIATIFSQPKNQLNEALIRHMILNSLRLYNAKYRADYGTMILACDSNSWRKQAYSHYKASRSTNREASDTNWTEIFEIMNRIRDEIEEFMPYPVLSVRGAEADDIIATLVYETQEFGQCERVMIISSDKDFSQLQRYDNVEQFSPALKKKVVEKNPEKFLFEHLIKGDVSDGVPNISSADDVFVSGARQTPIRSNRIDEWYESQHRLQEVLTDEQWRNYKRNETLIDLRCIPDLIRNDIVKEFQNKPKKTNSKVLNYLISKKCNQLISSAEEFFVKS